MNAPDVTVTPLPRPHAPAATPDADRIAINIRNLNVFYGTFHAVADVAFPIQRNAITALLGPSGCGKTTVLRALNRMNDLIPSARTEGEVLLDGRNIYAPGVDAVEVRHRVGMVFQKPNPFPKSIYDNIAFGPRLHGWRGSKGDMDDLVEHCLRRTALWDEVKHKLKQSALGLSGGQQQRLCIARALAIGPEVILMDEPCSALDPISTLKIEELMFELERQYTIVIVTHNMQQASRASDRTAFFMLDERRSGRLVEYRETNELFTKPQDKRTEDYITGRFG